MSCCAAACTRAGTIEAAPLQASHEHKAPDAETASGAFAARKSKGLSQQELAEKLNVVRQTVSKWERNLSVPDSDMLLAIARSLDTPVSALLGEPFSAPEAGDLAAIAAKLEVINLQLARRRESRRKVLRGLLITLAILALLAAIGGSYLYWDYSDPEAAVAGTLLHAFEWLFVRAAPFILIAALAGIILTGKRT